MLVPSTVANEVEPPSWGGARSHQATATTAMLIARLAAARTLRSVRERAGGVDRVHAAASATASWETEAIRYWDATTVNWVAATAVACGAVVLQVTLPAAFAHVYQEPPAASCAFTVAAAAGEIVNAT